MSYYLTVVDNYNKIVPKFNERDDREYEQFIKFLTEAVEHTCGLLDETLQQQFNTMMLNDDSIVNSYYMDLMSNVRKGEITHIPNSDLENLSKQQLIFGELVRNYIERMSCGYVGVKTTCIIWDTILLKTRKDPGDLVVSFCILMFLAKKELLKCGNIIEFCKVF